MRKGAWVFAMLLLLVSGAFGLINGIGELGSARTTLQRTVSYGVVLYGILGVGATVGLALRRRWSVLASAAWALAITYVATVASFAYSDPMFSRPGTLTGVASACLVTALIGAFVVWAARSATRARNLPDPVTGDHIPSP